MFEKFSKNERKIVLVSLILSIILFICIYAIGHLRYFYQVIFWFSLFLLFFVFKINTRVVGYCALFLLFFVPLFTIFDNEDLARDFAEAVYVLLFYFAILGIVGDILAKSEKLSNYYLKLVTKFRKVFRVDGLMKSIEE